MPQATLATAFGVKMSQENLEPVVLYEGARISGTLKTITLNEDMNNFEYLEFLAAFSNNGFDYAIAPLQVTPAALKNTAYANTLVASRANPSALAEVTVSNNAAATTSVVINTAAIAWNTVGVYKVIGYRRRRSQVGLDEILTAAAQPNLLLNTFLSSPLAMNQRSFDGDWSALAVGAYGPDMWFKYDSTRMAQIIEAGTCRPSSRLMFQANGGVVAEFVAPSDGGNFLVAVPFAWDEFDLRRSSVKVPPHPETVGRLADCKRYYLDLSGEMTLVSLGSSANANKHPLPVQMRVAPTITQTVSSGTGASFTATAITLEQNGVHSADSSVPTLKLDATLKVADVADDAQHRFIFG